MNRLGYLLIFEIELKYAVLLLSVYDINNINI